MQATGVYWTALYDVLESYGLEVNVAHAQHTKTLPGRKTDVQECQWLQKRHTFGLLNKAFRPAEEIRVLRSYLRRRENLVAAAAMCVQHMQKALTEMNIQLANVISDISGTTGMAILRDIVRGERDPEKLARHKHARIRASRQEIARSLEGTWREELLFVVGYQWRQGAQARDPARSESRCHRFTPGCLEPDPKPKRAGCKVSSPAIQTWGAQNDHSDGPHLGSTYLSHAQVRSPVRGSRNRVLRSQIPTATTTLDG